MKELKKAKNFYLIKLVSKWKTVIRKKHFLVFYFRDSKLVPINSALNSASNGKCWNQNLFTESWPWIVWMEKDRSNFDCDRLTCDPLCFLPKTAQIMQKVTTFFLERREEVEPWFWHIWIAQSLKFLYTTANIFFNFGHLQGKTRGQIWNKCANFGSVPFP